MPTLMRIDLVKTLLDRSLHLFFDQFQLEIKIKFLSQFSPKFKLNESDSTQFTVIIRNKCHQTFKKISKWPLKSTISCDFVGLVPTKPVLRAKNQL